MRPAYRVIVAGKDVTQELDDGLSSLSVTDEAGIKSDEVTVKVSDLRRKYALPRRGQSLSVALGYRAATEVFLTHVGTYTINQVSLDLKPRRMTITARAADTSSTLTERATRTWETGESLGTIVSTIASLHGLTPVVSEDLRDLEPGHIDQFDESDLNLLSRLSNQYGLVMKIQDGRLLMLPKGRGVTSSGIFLPTIEITPDMVESLSLCIEDRDQVTEAIAYWHDDGSGTRKRVTAGGSGAAKSVKVPGSFTTRLEAFSAAQSALYSSCRRNLKISLSMSGYPSITAEGRVVLLSFEDEEVNGVWCVEKVRHEFSGGTFKTALDLTPPHGW